MQAHRLIMNRYYITPDPTLRTYLFNYAKYLFNYATQLLNQNRDIDTLTDPSALTLYPSVTSISGPSISGSNRKRKLTDEKPDKTNKKTHQCKECSYAAASPSKLEEHMRTHTGEKPFKCTECGYAAAQKNVLVNHLTTHTNKRPFPCPYESCEYGAKTKNALRSHLKHRHKYDRKKGN